jgi:hypothetical protein
MLHLQNGRHVLLRFKTGSWALFGFVLCACVLLSGCQKRPDSQSGIVIAHEITPPTPRVGPATITLTLTETDGKPVNGARVSLEGDMTHAGMRPVFGEAGEFEPGRYRAHLEFTMGGDWVILIHLTLPDGRKVERQFDVKGVQSG